MQDATTFLEIVALGLRSLEKVRPKDIAAPALGVLANLFHTRASVADGEIGPSMLFAAEPAFHNEVFLGTVAVALTLLFLSPLLSPSLSLLAGFHGRVSQHPAWVVVVDVAHEKARHLFPCSLLL